MGKALLPVATLEETRAIALETGQQVMRTQRELRKLRAAVELMGDDIDRLTGAVQTLAAAVGILSSKVDEIEP